VAHVGGAGRGDHRGNRVRRRARMGGHSREPFNLSDRLRPALGGSALAKGDAAVLPIVEVEMQHIEMLARCIMADVARVTADRTMVAQRGRRPTLFA
jgi:hypothetical protein